MSPAASDSTSSRRVVVVGFFGTTLDAVSGPRRWERWRPTVGLFQRDDVFVRRLELLASQPPPRVFLEDIKRLSPKTEVIVHPFPLDDPWDLEEVYAALHDWVRVQTFSPEEEDLWIHITTGSHVMQICLFLLTEARFLPGRLLQTAPPRRDQAETGIDLIDLNLARYDRIATRFAQTREAGSALLKAGIATRNGPFNDMIDRIATVAVASDASILLTGPTGAGKSRLARAIYTLKRTERQLSGPWVEVNCATLRGDQAMSALFGHRRGAFTGAVSDREGLLKAADGGLLFLDEIGELGLDEQAMLLHALEDRRFLPVGSDREVQSEFQLIAGTNRDLRARVEEGRFREDLLARIDLWHFELPGLADRLEDVEPNLAYELEQFARSSGRRVSFNREAQAHFVAFATSADALWKGNFRDLNAAVVRMATLSTGGRINVDGVQEEMARLRRAWRVPSARVADRVVDVLGEEAAEQLDRFDRVQLADVLEVCKRARTLSDAGRTLFAVSRTRRRTVNDADRLRKYLARFGLEWDQVC